MEIAVLSGKGGTGKTFIATNLADMLSRHFPTLLLDCDVEEPNSRLFFETEIRSTRDVILLLPRVNQDLCTHCGKCSDACQFGAIVSYTEMAMVFDNLCHGCGVCTGVCPESAISEIPKPIGTISYGQTKEGPDIGTGILNIGEPSGVRVIRQLKKNNLSLAAFTILDSPPGASCPVVETLRHVDFAILVTEATPFGLHDLQAVIKIVRDMRIPFGVIINRDTDSFPQLFDFLASNNIPLLARIPWDLEIAKVTSSGKLYNRENVDFEERIKGVFEKIQEMVQ